MTTNANRQEQPGSPGESVPAGGQQQSIREQFRQRLFNERQAREAQEGGESEKEQPRQPEPNTGRVSETQDEDEYETDDKGDAAGQESDLDDEFDEEEEPGPEEDQPATLTVDDRQYTADDIRELERKALEYDADYRRKTQIMARIRQEYKAKSEEVEQVSGFFENLARANVQQLEQIDPRQLDQEQFAVWRQQLDNAKRGEQQLLEYIKKVRLNLRQQREQMLDHQARESSEILKGIDRRWSNQFYGELRDFAVSTGRFTKEEFADLTDWRTLEGLIALYDREKARENVKNKRETVDPPTKRRRRRANRQPRNDKGQFQSAEQQVRSSTNAKADGSLRQMFQAKLAAERQRSGG